MSAVRSRAVFSDSEVERSGHDVRHFEHSPGEIVGDRLVVAEPQVQPVLLRGGTERHHDDGVCAQALLGHRPCQILEPHTARGGCRPLRRLSADRARHPSEHQEQHQAAEPARDPPERSQPHVHLADWTLYYSF
jgi:hypothetical protein